MQYARRVHLQERPFERFRAGEDADLPRVPVQNRRDSNEFLLRARKALKRSPLKVAGTRSKYPGLRRRDDRWGRGTLSIGRGQMQGPR